MVTTEDGGGERLISERLARRYPFGLAIVIFLLAFWLSFTNALVGFPDGHLTDLDEAEQPLIAVFNWISIVVGLWLIVLGLFAAAYVVGAPGAFVARAAMQLMRERSFGTIWIIVTNALIGFVVSFPSSPGLTNMSCRVPSGSGAGVWPIDGGRHRRCWRLVRDHLHPGKISPNRRHCPRRAAGSI